MHRSWLLIERMDSDVLYGYDVMTGDNVSVALPNQGTVGKEALKHKNSAFSGVEGFQADGAQVLISHDNPGAIDDRGRTHINADYMQVLSQPEVKNTKVKHQVREGAMRLFVYAQGRNENGTVFRPITTQNDLKRVVEATVHGAKNPNPPLRVIIQELGLTRAKLLEPDQDFFKGATQVWQEAGALLQNAKTKGLGAGMLLRVIDAKSGKPNELFEFYTAAVNQDTDLKGEFNKNRATVSKAYNKALKENHRIEVIPFISYSLGKESSRSLARQLNSSTFQLESFGKWALDSHTFAGAAFQAQFRQDGSGGKYMFATNNMYRFGEPLSPMDLPATHKISKSLNAFKPLEKFMIRYKSERKNLNQKYLQDMTENLVDQPTAENVVPLNLTKAVPQRQSTTNQAPVQDVPVFEGTTQPRKAMVTEQTRSETSLVDQADQHIPELKAASRPASANLKSRVDALRRQYMANREAAAKQTNDISR